MGFRLNRVLAAVAATSALAMSLAPASVAIAATPEIDAVPESGIEMYRLYNPNSGEHFYTASQYERDVTVAAGWNYEGVGWKAPAEGEPVWRLYNPNAGDHHYTVNANERDTLIGVGWIDEGMCWYSAGHDGVPIWRQYNPNVTAGAHNFTADKNEHVALVRIGWKGEGIAWYGLE